ncbi:MAG: CBS domain-containing protein [Aureispira sp.]|nr:CBS domain-containing protein [Aureispira sp.]
MDVANKMLDAPISDIMSTHLKTVLPNDNLLKVKELFDAHHIHHVPVTRYKELLGIISKSDFLAFIKKGEDDDTFLEGHLAEEIMKSKIVKASSDQRIAVAALILLENFFHCVPVIDENELVGLVTPFDIMKYCYNTEYPEHPFKSLFH